MTISTYKSPLPCFLIVYLPHNDFFRLPRLVHLGQVQWCHRFEVECLVIQVQFEQDTDNLLIVKSGCPMQGCPLDTIRSVYVHSFAGQKLDCVQEAVYTSVAEGSPSV